MQFSTPVPVSKNDNPISYESNVLSLGSCFAENMAEKLTYFGFRNVVNPFGILYQPQAIETIIRFAVDGKVFTTDDLVENNERFHCFDAHSDLSQASADETVSVLNEATAILRESIASASHIIITLGSAWQYRLKSTGKIVANCHKVPASEFVKELASVESIVGNLDEIYRLVKSVNPKINFIFTVSPVRHIKDGFVENQRSKSHLISALHEFLAGTDATYFPSYEIMMDELRDYRFYAADMVHPNQTAIDYIWEKFSHAAIDRNADATMKEMSALRTAMAHRPFNAESDAHRKFMADIAERRDRLKCDFGIEL